MGRKAGLQAVAAWALWGCGVTPAATQPPLDDAPTQVMLVATADPAPPGSDAAPRLSLSWRAEDGTLTPLPMQATAYASFREGVALVDVDGRLLLVTRDGRSRVLAQHSGAPPATGPHGELVFVSQHDLQAEVHVLHDDGQNRIVASGLSSAGVLAPQPDGRLVFVGATNGGVAGLWIASEGRAAKCLTNCALRAGEPWHGAHVPLPVDADAIELRADRIEYSASDGSVRVVSLVTPASTPPSTRRPPPSVDAPADNPTGSSLEAPL